MSCKCNTANYDPNCCIDHTNSIVQVEMAFSHHIVQTEGDDTAETSECPCQPGNPDDQCPTHGFNRWKHDLEQKPYIALDELLKAVSSLPMSFIGARPPLYQAYNKGVEVLDQIVKEGRYVPK